MMIQIPVDYLVNLDSAAIKPRYPKEKVKELWGGKEFLTPLEILDLPIQLPDRLWIVLREEVIGESACKILARVFIERALIFSTKAEAPKDVVDDLLGAVNWVINKNEGVSWLFNVANFTVCAIVRSNPPLDGKINDTEQRWQIEKIREVLSV